MPPTLISPAPFPLLDGESLWRLPNPDPISTELGALVTVRVRVQTSADGQFIPFAVDGRQLLEDGAPRVVQGPFDAAPAAVTLPMSDHSIQHAALANGVTTITAEMARFTAVALEQWAGYLAAHAAVLSLPRVTP